MESYRSPTESDGSPMGVRRSPMESDGSPMGVRRSPMESDRSPTESDRTKGGRVKYWN